MQVTPKVAFITGASSGIGHATALAFVKEGIHVVGIARNIKRLNQLKSLIAALPYEHGDFVPLVADVRDPIDLHNALNQTTQIFERLDILVANAGIGHSGPLVDAEWDDLETIMRTNMDGVLHSIRACVPLMRKTGDGGHVIIISSIVYNMTAPNTAIYSATKAFVSSISHSLRLELDADKINVTDILVGRTISEFNHNRLGYKRIGNFPPSMSVEKVAESIVKATKTNRKSIAIRWIDRLVVLGNLIIPDIIGRLALRQYK